MAKNQTISNHSPLSATKTSKQYRLSKKSFSYRARKKTSIEDLEEEGYTIGRVLGEGSYCKVRSALFQGDEIAVKIITRDQLSVDFETKFLPRELKVLATIKHPNIVEVYKIFRYPKRIFIFMELIEKGDLLHYVRSRGRLMEFEAHHYFKQMVSAIQYLHSLNIAHRDLKCENVMLTDDDIVKIIDFGFCRFAVNEENRRVLSSTFCGSTAYAAPEVLQGKPYNPMMYDIWSLGCVLYIMVTGTMPFDDSNVRKMVSCQQNKQWKFPSTFTITKPVRILISRMLEPDVLQRTNINQISESLWLKQGVADFRERSSSLDVGSISLPYPIDDGSTSIHKNIGCAYEKLHASGKCNCKTNDSE